MTTGFILNRQKNRPETQYNNFDAFFASTLPLYLSLRRGANTQIYKTKKIA